MGFLDKLFGPPPTIESLKSANNAAALLKALGDTDPGRRREAAEALRELPAATRALPEYAGIKSLEAAARSDADPGVRESATRAVIALIVHAIENSTHPAERASNVRLLGEWTHTEARAALEALLASPDSDVREAALDALRSQSFDLGAVVPLLSDSLWVVRAAAARALRSRPEAAESLVPLLSDEHDLVRAAAAIALGEAGNVRSVPRLLELSVDPRWDRLQAPAATAFDLLARTATETLAKAVSGTVEDPRALAVNVLQKIPVGDVSPAVTELVACYAENPEGFVMSSGDPEVLKIRRVGAWLNERGGKDKMLQAHFSFSALVPRGARNLEMLWDGIGDWRG